MSDYTRPSQIAMSNARQLATPFGTFLIPMDTPSVGLGPRLAVIQSEGPSEEEDYSDARYWVRLMGISNSDGDETAKLVLSNWGTASWFTATNLTEWNSSDGGTHNIVAGTVVQLQAFHDAREEQEGHVVYWTFSAGSVGLLPITLVKTSGLAGDKDNQCDYRYTVSDARTSEELAIEVDPSASPHTWIRPSFGHCIPATHGYAHINEDGDLAIGWINEVPDAGPCSE